VTIGPPAALAGAANVANAKANPSADRAFEITVESFCVVETIHRRRVRAILESGNGALPQEHAWHAHAKEAVRIFLAAYGDKLLV
jgi:hypothetical protein